MSDAIEDKIEIFFDRNFHKKAQSPMIARDHVTGAIFEIANAQWVLSNLTSVPEGYARSSKHDYKAIEFYSLLQMQRVRI